MRTFSVAVCLGLAVLAACSQNSTPGASPAASAPLSNADQPTVKGAGASAAPSGQVAAPAEGGRTISLLYREGREGAVLEALGIFVGCVALIALLMIGVPRRFRPRAQLPWIATRGRDRQSRAA